MADQLTEYPKTWKIPFEDHPYSLTIEWPDKHFVKEIKNSEEWHWPALKFVPYKNGVFTLLNNHNQSIIYKTAELRDALIIDWFLNTGGWITVFKEHYAQFAEEVLIPLLGKYPVDVIPTKKKKIKIPSIEFRFSITEAIV